MEVADTGAGIAQENLKRILTPSSPPSRWAKARPGLSLSYGIVQKHSGRMEVHSELGVAPVSGSRCPSSTKKQPPSQPLDGGPAPHQYRPAPYPFAAMDTDNTPLIPAEAAAPAPSHRPPHLPSPGPCCAWTMSPASLSALKRVLRAEDCKVLQAGGGAEAIAVLEQHPVDVVVSDMRMPGMDGAALLAQVRARWPPPRAFCSRGMPT